MTNSSLPAASDSSASTTLQKIEARPLRHPWRWVFATLLALLAIWFIISSARNEAFGWGTYFQYLFDTRIATAALHTIAITILAMIIGVVGGAALAVMRMSPNPVLGGVSWVFLWLFRGTPIYVQLVFWGLLSALYQSINLGFTEISLTEVLNNAFLLSVLGLGLNEAAYMAEIVRSGISSVPEGQKEASKALGMGWWMTMRRTVLPQAMRIIIPPTGNEFISLLKTSSLVVAIPYTAEIFGRATDISAALFEPIPLLMVAATWYLAITSLLMVGQYFLERRFERGATRELTGRQLAALADAEGTIPRNVSVIPEVKN
ncbi:amino acid ABC transporter permease [Corynebacterium aurimucosum]|uniref:amino acid ABC transporter permease n=1 Tax=Corynebacterium aurimucosum TaxID=169292 RepID=UPI0001BCEFF8|nr:amino acid ABC transporter permease [Corynebacterium aurimucosum]QQU92881.1 amino acid ABC transporter permease [Corynebacterium aurimucosum]